MQIVVLQGQPPLEEPQTAKTDYEHGAKPLHALKRITSEGDIRQIRVVERLVEDEKEDRICTCWRC